MDHSSPYLTQRQLLPLVGTGTRIDVVAVAESHRKGSFWYGEWAIRVPEQAGEPERFLVSMRTGDGPKLRISKTANGLISLMRELGFQDVCLPMENGGAVSHRIGRTPSAGASDTVSASHAGPVSPDAVRTGLLYLAHYGFVSARHTGQLIAAGHAEPVALTVSRDGDWPYELETIRLTISGRRAVLTAGRMQGSAPLDPEGIPDWERAIAEDYIRQKADAGVYVENIVCAKAWYTGSGVPERRTIPQPPVLLRVSERRKRRA